MRIGAEDTETTCPISADTVKVGEWAARMPCGHYFGKHDLFEVLNYIVLSSCFSQSESDIFCGHVFSCALECCMNAGPA